MAKQEQSSEFDSALQTIMTPIKIGDVSGGYDKLSAHLLNLRKMKAAEKKEAAEQLGKQKEDNVKAWKAIDSVIKDNKDKMYFPFTESMQNHMAMTSMLVSELRKDLVEKGIGMGESDLYNNPKWVKLMDLQDDPMIKMMAKQSEQYLAAQDELSKNKYYGAEDVAMKAFESFYSSMNQDTRRKMDQTNTPYLLRTPAVLARIKQDEAKDLATYFQGLGKITQEGVPQGGQASYQDIEDENGEIVRVKTGQLTTTNTDNLKQLQAATNNVIKAMHGDNHKFRMMNEFMTLIKGEDWAKMAYASGDKNSDGVVDYVEGTNAIKELYNSLSNDEFRLKRKDGTVEMLQYIDPFTGEKIEKELGLHSYIEAKALEMAAPKMDISYTMQGGNSTFGKSKGEGSGSDDFSKTTISGLGSIMGGITGQLQLEDGGLNIGYKNGNKYETLTIPKISVDAGKENKEAEIFGGQNGYYPSAGKAPNVKGAGHSVYLENAGIKQQSEFRKYWEKIPMKRVDGQGFDYDITEKGGGNSMSVEEASSYKSSKGSFNDIDRETQVAWMPYTNGTHVLGSELDEKGNALPAEMIPFKKLFKGASMADINEKLKSGNISGTTDALKYNADLANLGLTDINQYPKVFGNNGNEHFLVNIDGKNQKIPYQKGLEIMKNDDTSKKIFLQNSVRNNVVVLKYTDVLDQVHQVMITPILFASAYYRSKPDAIKDDKFNIDIATPNSKSWYRDITKSSVEAIRQLDNDEDAIGRASGFVKQGGIMSFGQQNQSYIIKAWIPLAVNGAQLEGNKLTDSKKVGTVSTFID